MVIRQLKLRNFGSFKERSIYLRSKFAVISNQDEQESHIILAFIRCMLYGVSADDQRYLIKEAENCCGEMLVEIDDEIYQLKRNFQDNQIEIVHMQTRKKLENLESMLKYLQANLLREEFQQLFPLAQSDEYSDIENCIKIVQSHVRDCTIDEQIEQVRQEIQGKQAHMIPFVQTDYYACNNKLNQEVETLRSCAKHFNEKNEEFIKQNKRKQEIEMMCQMQQSDLSDSLQQAENSMKKYTANLELINRDGIIAKPEQSSVVYSEGVFLIGLIGAVACYMIHGSTILWAFTIIICLMGLIGSLYLAKRYNIAVKHWNTSLELRDKIAAEYACIKEISKQLSEVKQKYTIENQLLEEKSAAKKQAESIYQKQKMLVDELEHELQEKKICLDEQIELQGQIQLLKRREVELCGKRDYEEEQNSSMLLKTASWYLKFISQSKYQAIKLDESDNFVLTAHGFEWKLRDLDEETLYLVVFCVQMAVADKLWVNKYVIISLDQLVDKFENSFIKNMIEVLKKNRRQVILLNGRMTLLEYWKMF